LLTEVLLDYAVKPGGDGGGKVCGMDESAHERWLQITKYNAMAMQNSTLLRLSDKDNQW
jgi:hypothetical protein